MSAAHYAILQHACLHPMLKRFQQETVATINNIVDLSTCPLSVPDSDLQKQSVLVAADLAYWSFSVASLSARDKFAAALNCQGGIQAHCIPLYLSLRRLRQTCPRVH